MSPGENHSAPVGGMQSTSGSQGELSDRPGSPGFGTSTTQSVSGSATKEPDRDAQGFPVER